MIFEKKGTPIAALAALLLLGAGCASYEVRPSQQEAGVQEAAEVVEPSGSDRLDLSGKGLKTVPSYVFDRTRTEELDLSDNQLTGAIPAEIRQLRGLRVLDASGNLMTGVPAEIGQLSQLEVLDLSDNRLTGLPLELGNLRSLRRLDLRGNEISKQDLDAIRANLDGTEILE